MTVSYYPIQLLFVDRSKIYSQKLDYYCDCGKFLLISLYFVPGRIPVHLFHIFWNITFSPQFSTQLSMIFQMLHGTWLQWSTLLLLLGTRLLLVVAQCGSFTQDRQEKEDKQDKLALYKVTLRTYWSRARFPRHYPEWKPPAQFGKLIGESLNSPSCAFSTIADAIC